MPTKIEIIWLAGLLDGEGSFVFQGQEPYKTPAIQLEMTDKDIVERAARIMGAPIGQFRKRAEHHKGTYRTELSGIRIKEVANAILPYMGERRSARIKELLLWEPRKAPQRQKDAPNDCGHTERPHFFKGLCQECAMEKHSNHIAIRYTNICGHTDRPYFSSGKCRTCYDKGMIRKRDRTNPNLVLELGL